MILITLLTITGCSITFISDDEKDTLPANDIIREKAYFAAEYYLNSGMEYELGGSDQIYVPPYTDTRGIDCSGLIINVYTYAVEGSNYSLPFTDQTADGIYHNYSVDIDTPQKGDLIIWTDNNDHAYHIALFKKTENGYYNFIESNVLPEYGINGVAHRRMLVNTSYIISIKRLKLVDNNS